MGKRLKREEFIERAKKVHGNKYDYSESEFISTHKKVDIICPIHGVFSQIPKNHLRGQGCPECGREDAKECHKNNYDLFIKRVIDKFGDVVSFPYIDCEYENKNSIITYVCRKCGKEYRKVAGYMFANKTLCSCQRMRNDKKTEKVKAVRKSRLIDADTIEKRISSVYPTIEFIGKDNYVNTSTPALFRCSVCGKEFMRKANTFLVGNLKYPCPHCSSEKEAAKKTKTESNFITDFESVYGAGKYELLGNYKKSSEKVLIKCNDCGRVFEKEANSFLQGNGCPYHNCNSSVMEKDILSFVRSICPDAIPNDRKTLEGNELDIFVPSKNIAFEFDGIFWHNELNKEKDYHLKKTEACISRGIRLIHIFEDEWMGKKDIWKSMIRNILGVTDTKIYARKCDIRNVGHKECTKFLNSNHIQGYCPSQIRIGLYFEDELVSVMTFGKSRHFIGSGKFEYELLRFCNKTNVSVTGGASRLLSNFIRNYDPSSIVSYADRRWSVGNLYENLGFEMTHTSNPNYFYVIGGLRKNRFNFRKSVLVKKYGCPENMSERKFCRMKKWYRIYDCGCLVYEWKNKKIA